MSATGRHLEIWNLSKSYATSSGEAVIVRDFNLHLRAGEFVAIIGHSGCGKSTVLSIVAGLLEASGGGVAIAGREIDGPGPDRGVVFQSPCLLPWLTALDNVRLGVDEVCAQRPRRERLALAERMLDLVGLAEAQHKRPAELSAGMRQRVGIARAIALSPRVLLLDEPFGMLDSLTRMELQDVLVGVLAEEPKTVLMVTHDVDEALFLSDRVAMMTSGPAASLGRTLSVPFARPRERHSVLAHSDYYALREELIGFLEEQAHEGAAERRERDARESASREENKEAVA
jgi:nitrate/nitrite transport system ATP-binding protein